MVLRHFLVLLTHDRFTKPAASQLWSGWGTEYTLNVLQETVVGKTIRRRLLDSTCEFVLVLRVSAARPCGRKLAEDYQMAVPGFPSFFLHLQPPWPWRLRVAASICSELLQLSSSKSLSVAFEYGTSISLLG